MTIINMVGGGAGGVGGSVAEFNFPSADGIGNMSTSMVLATDGFSYIDATRAIARIGSNIYLITFDVSGITSQTVICPAWSTSSSFAMMDAWETDTGYAVLYSNSAFTNKPAYVREIVNNTSQNVETFPSSTYIGTRGIRVDADNYVFSGGSSNGFTHMSRTADGWTATNSTFGSSASMVWSTDRQTVVFNGSSLHMKLDLSTYQTEDIANGVNGTTIGTFDEVYIRDANNDRFVDSNGNVFSTIPFGEGELNSELDWSVNGVNVLSNAFGSSVPINIWVNGYFYYSYISSDVEGLIFTNEVPGSVLSNKNTIYVFE